MMLVNPPGSALLSPPRRPSPTPSSAPLPHPTSLGWTSPLHPHRPGFISISDYHSALSVFTAPPHPGDSEDLEGPLQDLLT